MKALRTPAALLTKVMRWRPARSGRPCIGVVPQGTPSTYTRVHGSLFKNKRPAAVDAER